MGVRLGRAPSSHAPSSAYSRARRGWSARGDDGRRRRVLVGADRFAGSVDVGADARAVLCRAIWRRPGRVATGGPVGRTRDVLSAAAVVASAAGIARADEL